MRTVQHQETGMQYQIGDNDQVPRRCYEVPNCTHGELTEPSGVCGSSDPLNRHCVWCGMAEDNFNYEP